MTRAFAALFTVFLALVAFTATAAAAGAVAPADSSLLDLARPIYDAVMHGQYWLGASLALVLAVTAFKRYAPAGKASDFANSDEGGAILVLAGAFGGALATGLVAVGTNAVSFAMAWTALKIALGAAGGYALVKKLLVDRLIASDWYKTKAPGWVKAVLGIALWAFVKPDPVAAAEAAGDKAVVANPAPGVNGPAGTPTDL